MKTVLLLIPGMFNTGAIWDPVVGALQALADAPEVRIAQVLTQDSITAMADDAWRLVSDLPPGTPLVLCGFSMGGYVALELMAAHPGRVQALALVDSSAAVETPESTAVREKTISALERNFARTVDTIITFSLHPDSLHNTALVDGMRAMMHAVGPQAAIRQTRAIIGRRDHQALLRQLDLPALIVCGREDKVTPPAGVGTTQGAAATRATGVDRQCRPPDAARTGAHRGAAPAGTGAPGRGAQPFLNPQPE